jgi:hypothetical protein
MPFAPFWHHAAHFNRRIWGHFKNPPLYVAVSECEMCLKVAQMRFVQSPIILMSHKKDLPDNSPIAHSLT